MRMLYGAVLALACALPCTSAGAQNIEDLQRELAVKSARIEQLEQRLREREKQNASSIVFSKHSITASPVRFSKQRKESQSKATVNESVSVVSRPIPAEARASAQPQTPRIGGPPPDRDDEDLDRALERTLVREGALVLPPWVSELTPQFSYAHWDKIQNPYVRNSYTAALGYRLGLPWGFQVSAGLPYTYSQFRDGTSDSGLGDAGFLLSKELLLESQWTPNLVGSAGWTSPTRTGSGNTTTPIPYVSGFQAGLTASKRLDPLVVFGTISYFSSAARDIAGTRVDPSDVLATRVGGSIALSPASSITAGFNLAYLTNTTAADFIVPNSDRVLSSVDVGYTTILWKRTLLNVTGQFGLTGNVPDFRLITSIPVRF